MVPGTLWVFPWEKLLSILRPGWQNYNARRKLMCEDIKSKTIRHFQGSKSKILDKTIWRGGGGS